MSRVLFTWELGEGLGHVTSQRPLAAALQERGHKVVLAVRNVRSAATAFEGSGLSFIQCPHQTWQVAARFRPIVSYAHMLHSIGFNGPEGLASLVAAWTHLFELVDPDLIVFDHSPTALLAARPHRAKRVLQGLGFFAPPAVHPLPQIQSGSRADPSQLAKDEEEVLRLTNAALAGTTVPVLRRLAEIYSDIDLNLLMTYEELDHFGPRNEVRYWGVQSSCGTTLPEWPRADGRRIFAYLKPAPGLSDLFGRLNELGYPTIVYGAWVDENAQDRFGSSTLTLERRPLDVGAVAEKCDLAILNGTHGTTAEMLLRGIPVLQIPIFVEQALTAQKTVALGAGLMADPRNAGAVAARLDQILNSNQYKQAAGRFAAKYAGIDADQLFDELIDLVVDLLP